MIGEIELVGNLLVGHLGSQQGVLDLANQDIKIIPRVEGYLQGVHVKEGDAVKAGQLLFRIDDATYRAAVVIAKKALKSLFKSNDLVRI